MKFNRQILGLILSPIILSACSSYYYAPNMHNVPLFKEEKQARVNITYPSVGEVSIGTDLQLAYSPIPHLGVMANGFYTGTSVSFWYNSNSYEYSLVGTTMGFGELGLGYFDLLGKNIVYEFYGGFGLGTVTNLYSNDFDSYEDKVHMDRLFIQSAIGLNMKYFEVAISSRIIRLNYFKPEFGHRFSDANMWFITYRPYYLLEPGFTIRGGWPAFKLQMQLVYSFNITDPEFAQDHVNANIGIQVGFGVKSKKKKIGLADFTSNIPFEGFMF